MIDMHKLHIKLMLICKELDQEVFSLAITNAAFTFLFLLGFSTQAGMMLNGPECPLDAGCVGTVGGRCWVMAIWMAVAVTGSWQVAGVPKKFGPWAERAAIGY